MGIYGNLANLKTASKVEKYIDECFLDIIVNEAAVNIEKEIRDLQSKEKVSESEIKDIFKKIENIENEKTKRKLLLSCTGSLISLFGSYASMLFTATGNIAVGLPVSLGSLTLALGSLYLAETTKADEFYYKLMKIEAKARVEISKAKKLDDSDERVKKLEEVVDICEKMKKLRRESLRNQSSQPVEESVDYLVEYKGNDVKNDIFVQILDDVDELCKANIDTIFECENTVKLMMSSGKECTKDTVKATLVKSREIGRRSEKRIDEIRKDIYAVTTFNFVRDEVKKFNTKYSYITMAEKKKLAAKLESYKKKIKEVANKYSANNEDMVKKVNQILDKMESFDVSARNEYAKLLLSWLTVLIDEANATIADIDYILKELNIEKTEKSIIYKVLNIGK